MIVRDLLVKIGFKGDFGDARKAEQHVDRLKSGIKSMAAIGAGILGVAGVRAYSDHIVDAVKTTADFGQRIAQVASLMPNSAGRIDDLTTSVLDMAAKTGRKPAELADGLYELISAFGDTIDIQQRLDLTGKLSRAGMADMTTSTKVLAAWTRGFGDTSGVAIQKASDLELRTVQLAQTRLPELLLALGHTVPAAAQMGVSQEELAATLATLIGVTGNARVAGSGLADTIDQLGKLTPEATRALRKFGFSSIEGALASKGFVGTLRGMVAQTDGSKKSLSKLIPSSIALHAVTQLVSKSAKTFDTNLGEMNKAVGTTSLAYAEAVSGAGGLQFAMDKMSAKAEVAKIAFGEKFSPAVLEAQVNVGALKRSIDEGLSVAFISLFGNMNEGTASTDSISTGIRDLIGFIKQGAIAAMWFGEAIAQSLTGAKDLADEMAFNVATRLNPFSSKEEDRARESRRQLRFMSNVETATKRRDAMKEMLAAFNRSPEEDAQFAAGIIAGRRAKAIHEGREVARQDLASVSIGSLSTTINMVMADQTLADDVKKKLLEEIVATQTETVRKAIEASAGTRPSDRR